MAGFLYAVFALLLFALVTKVLLAAMLGGLYEWRSWHWLTDRFRPAPPPPPTRGLREITVDARRLAARYHEDGARFERYEARRQAFEVVLVEAAALVGVDHLLDVLPPGPERDRERDRVEAAMVAAGVLVEPVA